MWRSMIFVCFVLSCTAAQNQRNPRPFNNGHEWDIRLAVLGQPGNDYPTLSSIPRTSFTCSGKEPGYYADVETNCQVFRVCTFGATYGFQSFLCPNGTLFNQAVFVCDWWMRVNCKNSEDLFKINNNKFSNLKVGSQFMTDIKKMITHPVHNPLDGIYKNNNRISMQRYNPPTGQLYNRFLTSNLNSNLQTKPYQNNNYVHNANSPAVISFATTTPSSQYIPHLSEIRNIEYVQKQKQTSQPYVLPNRKNTLKNTHSNLIDIERASRIKSNDLTLYKYTQSVGPTQIYQRSVQNIKPHIELPHENRNSSLEKGNINQFRKTTEFGIEFAKQQLNQNQHDKHHESFPFTNVQFNKNIMKLKGNETKQNLVSSNTSPTIITKTLAFRTIIKDSTKGTPKSKITFKTWIVKPSKNLKLLAEPTSYTYDKPEIAFEDTVTENVDINNLAIEPTSNIENNEEPYIYNAPSVLGNQVITTTNELPNLNPDILPSSTTPQALISFPSTSPPTTSSLYLEPTTFKPTSLSYIPPIENEKQISREYLPLPIENNKLVAVASSPSPFIHAITKEPSFFLTKQTRINTNHNNLAFSELLTKEKLDITVNNIVKDTGSVLQTASPPEYYKLNEDIRSLDYPIDNYLSEPDNQSDEKLTLQPPPLLPKSSKLVATPSPNLEPPIESFLNINQSNKLLPNLSYYEEPTQSSQTIERTVSLKITIPENIANLLFRNRNIKNNDKLEILDTNSNNYLVLTNKKDNNIVSNPIPMGKLIWNKNSNISYSQDLVLSFLADSINSAREYNDIVQQNIGSSTQHTPTFQRIQKEKLEKITKNISQLTSSHFSSLNDISKSPDLRKKSFNKHEKAKLTHDFTNQKIQSHKQKDLNLKATPVPENGIDNLRINEKIYSGQLYGLPVPIVTKEIYNSQTPVNYIISNNAQPTESPVNSKIVHNKPNSDVEFIQSQTIEPNTITIVTEKKEAQTDQGRSANAFTNGFKIPINGITAQLHDNIIGTLPHPLDEDKLIEYKKDQTYYIQTHLNNENDLSTDSEIRSIQDIVRNNLVNTVYFPQTNKLSSVSTLQLIPSLSYKLEDTKEKQNRLNAVQNVNFANTNQKLSYNDINSIRQQGSISTDVDFTVDHSKTLTDQRPNYLYDGPNSYLAPQNSVGNLLKNNNAESLPNYNSKIEKFDTDDNSDNLGYPKIIPAKRFLF